MCTAALTKRGALTCRKKTKQINYSQKVECEGAGVINITLIGLLLTRTNMIRMGSKPGKEINLRFMEVDFQRRSEENMVFR